MKRFRRSLLGMLLSALVVAIVAPAAQASFGVTEPNWEAGTCKEAVPSNCKYSNSGSFYTQAAGHPPWGITKFTLNHNGNEVEGAPLKRIRVDIPSGLAGNPEALPKCSPSEFEAETCSATTKVGTTELNAIAEPLGGLLKIPLEGLSGNVYNLGETTGVTLEGHPTGPAPLLFGIDIAPAGKLITPVHLALIGHVAWNSDYHEFFEIDNVPTTSTVDEGVIPVEAALKVESTQLNFDGVAGNGNFLTLPSNCSTTTTSFLEVESYAPREVTRTETHTPVGVGGCANVPFKPTTALTAAPSQYDSPDGLTTDVKVPQFAKSINTADIQNAQVTLPEGLTLNPSAAHGLAACTQAELGEGTTNPVKCPETSKIGEVTIETDLPPGTLKGNVYLGKKNGTGTIGGPPYLIFLDAESVYGVSVRLEGEATPDANTGRLTVTFKNNPPLPFSDLILSLNGGNRAPLANSVTCGAASTDSSFEAYSGENIFKKATSSTPFTTTGCPSPVPFSLAQSTSQTTTKAGAFTSFTFNLSRNDGQQNLSSLQTTLPAGLVGLIPSIKRCATAQALAGSCPSTSQIGTASATAGVGSEPFGFSGPVYLTEAINGAPYGLFIPIEAAAGPFDLGAVKTYVTLNVDPHSGSVIASATLPRIVGGVPLHLRGLSVAVTKPNFLFNPTYCGGLTTSSLLSAIQGATSTSSSALPVASCSSLPFKPAFAAASPTAPSRANGASLTVSYTQPDHQANIRSVVAQLPKELPSRLTTLHNACAENIFANGNNYKSCPAGSKVGSVTVTTPVLPEKLTGPAYLVSHGGAAFPNLDLILEGDHGVKVVIEGTTNIKNGITTSSFPAIPDVPVSGFELNLPTGPNSALGSFDSLCAKPLYMPTTITAQSGTVLKQNLRLSIGSCKIKLLSHKIKKKKLVVRVQVFTAGRVSVTSPGLHTVYRKVGGPGIVTIKVPVSIKGKKKLASGHSLKVRARVGFNPKHKDEFHSAAFAKVTFRH
jgi:hypothetical protein